MQPAVKASTGQVSFLQRPIASGSPRSRIHQFDHQRGHIARHDRGGRRLAQQSLP
jgi:hypothetical protein